MSSYASSHPWEDFAETWAHYLHMIDTLETASAFGLSVRPKVGSGDMAAKLDFDPHGADMDPHHRSLAAAHLRDELDQSQHGTAGPLSLRAHAGGDR